MFLLRYPTNCEHLRREVDRVGGDFAEPQICHMEHDQNLVYQGPS